MVDTASQLLLEVRGVSKRFPGVKALDDVDLRLERGQVLAVIGENGAGKSTLMKILAGVQEPDEGEVFVDGQPQRIDSVVAAQRLGIALIHQELNLADNLDVGANVFLGREPRLGPGGLIDKRRIARETAQYLEQVGLDLHPRTLVSELSTGRQQMVEIAKALSCQARVLIMDEPTSSLSSHETEALFRVIHDLRGRGVSIIYISHRLSEVREVADHVTVLRDGCNVGELPRDEIAHDAMVNMMVGRDVSQFYHRDHHEIGAPRLEVKGLRVPGREEHALSFSVGRGEIVGMAGLVGAGRTELLQVLFGIDRPLGGAVWVDGAPVRLNGPLDAIAAGMALVPEDRKGQGLVLEMTVRSNITLAGLRLYQRGGMIQRRREGDVARTMAQKLNVKSPSLNQVVQFLSGGNQQKVVLAKWLSLEPAVLLLDEPTRGVDVGAKEEIYRIMEALARQGMAILFVSSEMEEILGMSDRTLVVHEGRIAGELQRDELSEEAVMQLATGGGTPAVPA